MRTNQSSIFPSAFASLLFSPQESKVPRGSYIKETTVAVALQKPWHHERSPHVFAGPADPALLSLVDSTMI